ncbi:MAG: tetratricopeptide repeat protein [Candidatus Omnitrophica bacterium]|nr:tetratricopeptide repeat protein [Candidatus Omnitrophota bacterium]
MKKFLLATGIVLIVFAVLMFLIDASSMCMISVICMIIGGCMLGYSDWLAINDIRKEVSASSVFCFLLALTTAALIALSTRIGIIVELVTPFLVLASLVTGGIFFFFYKKKGGLLCFKSVAITGVSLSVFMSMMVILGIIDNFSNFPESYNDRASQYKYWKASEYVSRDKWDAAIKELDEAIALSPDDGRYYEKRGYAYLSKGDDDKAMSDYKMMELYSNENSRGLSYGARGDVYLKRGEYDKAITDYSKAIELSKHFLEPYYQGRARAFFEKNEYDKAWEDLQKRTLYFEPTQEEDFVKKLKEWNKNKTIRASYPGLDGH